MSKARQTKGNETPAATLDDLVSQGTMSAEVAQLLRWAVISGKSIVVSGPKGSGKTTLLNALLLEIPHDIRALAIEYERELKPSDRSIVWSWELPPQSDEAAARDAVLSALAFRPQCLVMGECRGKEVAEVLTAAACGHCFLGTVEAASPAEAAERLSAMARRGKPGCAPESADELVGAGVDLIIQVEREEPGFLVTELADIDPACSPNQSCRLNELFTRISPEDPGAWSEWGACGRNYRGQVIGSHLEYLAARRALFASGGVRAGSAGRNRPSATKSRVGDEEIETSFVVRLHPWLRNTMIPDAQLAFASEKAACALAATVVEAACSLLDGACEVERSFLLGMVGSVRVERVTKVFDEEGSFWRPHTERTVFSARDAAEASRAGVEALAAAGEIYLPKPCNPDFTKGGTND